MSPQNYYPEDTDFSEDLLNEALSVHEETWWVQFANRECCFGAHGELESALSGAPITFTTAPENRVIFYGKDEVDFVASFSSSRRFDEKMEVAHREKFIVDAGCLQTRSVEYDINQQDLQSVGHSPRSLIRDLICLQDAIVQAAMFGICRGKPVYQMARQLLDKPRTMQEFLYKSHTTLAEKANSPFMSLINDLTKGRNSGQRVRPVSRILVTGSPAEGFTKKLSDNVSFYEYKEPLEADISIPTFADNAINGLTDQVGHRLTWGVLSSIMGNIYHGEFNCGTYQFEKAKIAKQFVKRLDNFCISENMNDEYITVVVNRETMNDLMQDKKGQIEFVPEFEWNNGFQNEGVVIVSKLGFKFCLIGCDNLPVYENVDSHRVGVAAILGKGALIVLHNDSNASRKEYLNSRNGKAENMTGVRVVREGPHHWRLRSLFGCARPAFCRKDESHLTDYGSIMLIHHGMRRVTR